MTLADLSSLESFDDRWRAYDDFERALKSRAMARTVLRWKTPGWRFDHRMEMRRAIRAWQHYKAAVRNTK